MDWQRMEGEIMKASQLHDIITQQNLLLSKHLDKSKEADLQAMENDRYPKPEDTMEEVRSINKPPVDNYPEDVIAPQFRGPASEPVFDPNKESEDMGIDHSYESPYSATEAAITGFGKGASMGYLPQIEAATEPIVQKAMQLIGGDPQQAQKNQGFNVENPKEPGILDGYIQRRDEQARAQEQMKQDYPTASGAGEIAGSISTAIGSRKLFPGKMAKTFLGKVGQAAKTGAITGLVRNPGESEGEVSPIQPIERATNTVLDTATGAGFQVLGSAIGETGKTLASSPKVKALANIRALRASGVMLKEARRILGRGKAQEVGDAALKEGIVVGGDDIHSIAEKAVAKKNELGKLLGDVYDQADDVVNNNLAKDIASHELEQKALLESMPKKGFVQKKDYKIDKPMSEFSFVIAETAKDLRKQANKNLTGLAGGEQAKATLGKIFTDLEKNTGEVDFSRVKKVRQSIDDMIDYNVKNNEMTMVQKELRNIRSHLQDQVYKALQDIDGKEGTNLASNFKRLNKRYSNVIELAAIATDKVNRITSNTAAGLGGHVTGNAAMATGGMIGAKAGGTVGGLAGAAIGYGTGRVAEHVGKTYGRAISADLTARVAKLVAENPKKMGVFAAPLVQAAKVSPQRLAIAVNMLKGNPDFVKLMSDEEMP